MSRERPGDFISQADAQSGEVKVESSTTVSTPDQFECSREFEELLGTVYEELDGQIARIVARREALERAGLTVEQALENVVITRIRDIASTLSTHENRADLRPVNDKSEPGTS